jgi:hydroxymethylbilane synthase
MKLRLGTRGSALAMTQARDISARLVALGHEPEIRVIKTRGDGDQVRPFAEVGAPGLFVREIERALLEDEIDAAVHCYKDLPSDSPAGLVVAAMPEREDTRDALYIRPGAHDGDAGPLPLMHGAMVGTASARRQALLRHMREDLGYDLLRGNVPTRLERLREGKFDAILLAAAGVARLDRAAQRGEGAAPSREGVIEVALDPTLFVPAPSQGALALQVREDSGVVRDAIAALDEVEGHHAVRAERALLALVDAGCQVPFGAYADRDDAGELVLHAALEVTGELRRVKASGTDPQALAERVFAELLPEGVRPQ